MEGAGPYLSQPLVWLLFSYKVEEGTLKIGDREHCNISYIIITNVCEIL